jgi:hypothetical protein
MKQVRGYLIGAKDHFEKDNMGLHAFLGGDIGSGGTGVDPPRTRRRFHGYREPQMLLIFVCSIRILIDYRGRFWGLWGFWNAY